MTISLGPSASTGTLEANQVKSDSLSVNGVDIDALIAQKIYAAFNVTPEIGLPATTACTTTRLEKGIYQVVFDDSWPAQFPNTDYSVLLTERIVGLGDIPAPSKRGLFWSAKTNTSFKVFCVEEEDSVDGDANTAVDPGRCDFACIRGAVVFAEGSFNFYGSL